MAEELEQTIENALAEGGVKGQGIHPLHRGLTIRKFYDDFHFVPSKAAEAAFGSVVRAVKRRAFNSWIADVESGKIVDCPYAAQWAGQVRVKGLEFWDKNPVDGKVPNYNAFEHCLLHTDATAVTGKQVGELIGKHAVVQVDDSERCYIEKNERRVVAHRLHYSANLSRGVPVRVVGGERGEFGMLGQETPYGVHNLRVMSKTGGRQRDTLSHWLASISDPFFDDGLDEGFRFQAQADFDVYFGNRGRPWSNLDADVLRGLRNKGLPTGKERECKIAGFHAAMALTQLYLEKRKPAEQRKISLLPVDEEKELFMPFSFVHLLLPGGTAADMRIENPGLIFEPLIMRYGLGMHYEEIDDYLLDKKKEEILSNQGKRMLARGLATLEVVRSTRGMQLRDTRRISKREYVALLEQGYRHQGFAVDFNEMRGQTGLRCVGYTFEQRERRRAAYLVYSEKIILPLVHEISFVGTGIDAVFPSDEADLIPRLPADASLLQMLDKEFEATDYRTGVRCRGRLRLPSTLTADERELYARWLGKAI